MERHISIEAKTFNFSAKDLNFRLEERRKGFIGFILVGQQCATWLVATVEVAFQSPEKEDSVKYFHEEGKTLMVSGCGNKAGRYLEVTAYAEGGQKGIIWIPEAHYGWGWHRFLGELHLM
jgi:hypothetical protein